MLYVRQQLFSQLFLFGVSSQREIANGKQGKSNLFYIIKTLNRWILLIIILEIENKANFSQKMDSQIKQNLVKPIALPKQRLEIKKHMQNKVQAFHTCDQQNIVLEGQSEQENLISTCGFQKEKADLWEKSEIRKLFALYTEFGSKWKLFQSQLYYKNANSIKNKFYTSIRRLLKSLFCMLPETHQKLPFEIPSTVILRLFEGRQEFVKQKGFGKRLLRKIKYDIESENLESIFHEYEHEIRIIYDLIFSNIGNKRIRRANLSAKKQRKDQQLSCSGTKKRIENIPILSSSGFQKFIVQQVQSEASEQPKGKTQESPSSHQTCSSINNYCLFLINHQPSLVQVQPIYYMFNSIGFF